MGIRKYTKEQIKDLLDVNLTSGDIARKYNDIPASTVRGWRRRNGVIIPKGFDYDSIDVEELKQKYAESKSLDKVSEYFKCDRHGLSKWIKENNIDIPIRQKVPEDIKQKVLSNYNNAPATEIAKKYNLNDNTVGGIWYRNGLRGKQPRMYELYNEDFFSKQSPDMAYFCGFIGSDGCVYTPKDTRSDILSITIQQGDVKILDVLKDRLKTTKPIINRTKNGKVYSNLQISSQKICDDLKNLGLGNRKTYSNTIANVEDVYMFDLIRGYIDGDGTINGDYGNVSIVGYRSNMEKIQKFLERFNIFSTITADKRIKKYNKNDFGDDFVTLAFPNKTSIYCLLKSIYYNASDCFLTRKKESAQKIIQKIENSKEIRDKQIIVYYENAVLRLRNAIS